MTATDAGFTNEYPDVTSYILGITERIWEGRGIGLIRDYYTADVLMHTAAGDGAGVEGVVAGTLATLNEFPDRRLLGEDVIWSGAGSGNAYSSHRIVSTMHHRSQGVFGPPTGRRVMVRTIADCLVRDGRICEEWLVRDQSAIALQLGLDPIELGRNLAAATPAPAVLPDHHMPPPTLHPAVEAMLRIWNETDLGAIRNRYDPAVNLHLPAGQDDFGHDGVERFVTGVLASIPAARLAIDHVIVREDPGHRLRLAVRWRLSGVHSGRGRFGAPSGVNLRIPGITHSELIDGKIVREFTLVDELAIWTAIARGPAATPQA